MKRSTLSGILMGVGAAGLITTMGVNIGYSEDVFQQGRVYEHVEQLKEGLAECRDSNYMDSEKCTIMKTSYDLLMNDPGTSRALYDYAKETRRNELFMALLTLSNIPLWLGAGLSIKPKKE